MKMVSRIRWSECASRWYITSDHFTVGFDDIKPAGSVSHGELCGLVSDGNFVGVLDFSNLTPKMLDELIKVLEVGN